MPEGSFSVLLVGGDAEDLRLVHECLQLVSANSSHPTQVSDTREACIAAGASSFDVALLDVREVGGAAPAVRRIAAVAPDMPVIVLTTNEDVHHSAQLVRQGAQDCVVRSRASAPLLAQAVTCAIERKRAQRELESFAVDLEGINAELEQFARVVSHDLQAPLAVIEMELKAIERACGDRPPPGGDHLQGALETAKEMRRLIGDLLRFARSSDDEPTLAEVDCDRIVRGVLEELEPVIASSSLHVDIEPLPTVWADPSRLPQLFRHLLTTMVESQSDTSAELRVSADFEGKEWLFCFESAPAEGGEEAAGNAASAAVSGQEIPETGVPLTICKRLVKAHGGRIWRDTRPGAVRAISFTLPARGWSASRPSKPSAATVD